MSGSDASSQLTLEVDGPPGEAVLVRTRVQWSSGQVIESSRTEWRGARAEALLAYFIRYKLWALGDGAHAGPPVFELCDNRDELAALMRNLVRNCRPDASEGAQWPKRIFGTDSEGRCLLKDVVETSQVHGAHVVFMRRNALPAKNVIIEWNAVEVDTVDGLTALLREIGFPLPVDESHPGGEHLEARVGVRVWPSPSPRSNHLSPAPSDVLYIGDAVQVFAELNMSAYVYLVWITSEGDVRPVYPWTPGRWDETPTRQKRVRYLERPEYDAKLTRCLAWRVQPPAGIETVVLLARRRPFSRDFDLRERLAELPKRTIQVEPSALKPFECHDYECMASSSRFPIGFGKAVVIDDPIHQTHALLRDRLGRYCSLIKAMDFVTRERTRSSESEAS